MREINHKSIFLHMGPGLNSYIESQVFHQFSPDILFWNQPSIHNESGAFKNLICAAKKAIEDLFAVHKKPIQVIAHSFSGLILEAVLREIDLSIIKSCTFIATGYHFENAFPLLLKALAKEPGTLAEDRKEIETFLSAQTTLPVAGAFRRAVEILFKHPDFFKLYWGGRNESSAFLQHQPHAPALDIETFFNVSINYLEHPSPLALSPFTGPVNMYLGGKDPLLDVSAEVKAWSKIFPQAKIEVFKDLGHFVHFEKNSLFL